MENFENVNRLEPFLDYEIGWDTPCVEMRTAMNGDYVMYFAYLELLNAYKELKHRMEGLEK